MMSPMMIVMSKRARDNKQHDLYIFVLWTSYYLSYLGSSIHPASIRWYCGGSAIIFTLNFKLLIRAMGQVDNDRHERMQ